LTPSSNNSNVQYDTSKSHYMTSAALANLRQVDNKSLRKFMDKFGRTAVQIRNLNPEVVLHSMLLALCPTKFIDNLCKKLPGSIHKLREQPKGYIQMEEMFRFQNEVHQAG